MLIENIYNLLHKEKTTSYCHALGSRLVFFGGMVAYCSNGNPSKNRAYPVIYDNFKGIEDFNIDELVKHILKDKKNLKRGKIPESCEGCPNLKNDEYPKDFAKNPQISYIQFSDYSLCNSKCIYCGSWGNTKFEDGEYRTKNNTIDSYDIIPIIKQLAQKNILTAETTIDFAGGEPTIYRQFEDALTLLTDIGIKNILVFSNSINWSPAIAKGIEKGIITLTVSVDAGTKEIHRKVKGVESYEQVYKNLENYSKLKKYDEQVISKYVIVPEVNDSLDEISVWIEKSKEIGIKKLILNADNRIFEHEFDQTVLLKLKEAGNYFLEQSRKNNIIPELYSNMYFVYQELKKNI